MKLILITTVVTLNPGDAAILMGTIRLLRRRYGPDVAIGVVDRQAVVAQKLYPNLKFFKALFTGEGRSLVGRLVARLGYEHRLKRLDFWRAKSAGSLLKRGLGWLAVPLVSGEELKTIAAYVNARLILASGGTYIVPAYDMTMPLMDYEFSLSLGAKFGTMPQSLGPLLQSELKARYSTVFNSAKFVYIRDQRSFDHLTEIGVRAEVLRIVPDAAFAILDERTGTRKAKRSTPPLVAISVRDWRYYRNLTPEEGWKQYARAIVGLVEWLVDSREARVVFISSCQGIPEYRTDDSATAEDIVSQMPQRLAAAVSIDRDFRTPTDLLEKLSEFDLIVATRMHVAILGVCSATPVLPIAYEFKTTELFAGIDLAELVVPIEEMEAETLIIQASKLLDRQADLSEHIYQQVAIRRTMLYSAIDELQV